MDNIESLVEKASKTNDSQDALRYSQAACNVAHALRTQAETKP